MSRVLGTLILCHLAMHSAVAQRPDSAAMSVIARWNHLASDSLALEQLVVDTRRVPSAAMFDAIRRIVWNPHATDLQLLAAFRATSPYAEDVIQDGRAWYGASSRTEPEVVRETVLHIHSVAARRERISNFSRWLSQYYQGSTSGESRLCSQRAAALGLALRIDEAAAIQTQDFGDLLYCYNDAALAFAATWRSSLTRDTAFIPFAMNHSEEVRDARLLPVLERTSLDSSKSVLLRLAALTVLGAQADPRLATRAVRRDETTSTDCGGSSGMLQFAGRFIPSRERVVTVINRVARSADNAEVRSVAAKLAHCADSLVALRRADHVATVP